MNYEHKYNKYKNKYLKLKQNGGLREIALGNNRVDVQLDINEKIIIIPNVFNYTQINNNKYQFIVDISVDVEQLKNKYSDIFEVVRISDGYPTKNFDIVIKENYKLLKIYDKILEYDIILDNLNKSKTHFVYKTIFPGNSGYPPNSDL